MQCCQRRSTRYIETTSEKKEITLFFRLVSCIFVPVPNCLGGEEIQQGLALGNLGHKYRNNLQNHKISRPTQPAEASFWDPDPRILNLGMVANALLRSTPAKALRLPADAFLGHRCGFLENLEVCNHGEMVRGECYGGKPVNANLLLSGHVQGG